MGDGDKHMDHLGNCVSDVITLCPMARLHNTLEMTRNIIRILFHAFVATYFTSQNLSLVFCFYEEKIAKSVTIFRKTRGSVKWEI